MDNHTKEQRRRNMQAVKNKDSNIEKKLRQELWARGLRYRKNCPTVFGKPDIAFIGRKIAVFCDGIYSALRLCTSKVRRLDLLPCREFSVDGGDAEGAARKFVVKDARVVIRRSGTEPKVRVMAECENEEKLDELCSRIKNYLEEK